MKIFADATETAFFKSDSYVKNLHEIEINSIKDFVHRYSIDPMVLLGQSSLVVSRFDELIPTAGAIAQCAEVLEIDFVKEIELIEVLDQILRYVSLELCDIEMMTDIFHITKTLGGGLIVNPRRWSKALRVTFDEVGLSQ